MSVVRRRRARALDESGQVLILSVIVLVLMLGISALVIDVGYAKTQHRSLQNAADASALGAAQSLATDTQSAATTQAVNLGNDNLPKFAPLSWGGSCDSSPLAIISSVGNCISFSPTGVVRVRIPEQRFSTLFGGAIGIKSLSTGAVAEAQIQEIGPGGVEPFAMGFGFNSGAFCLDSGSSGTAPAPCDGASDGNFGLLNFANCGGSDPSVPSNEAEGADHPYGTQPALGVNVVPDDCTQVNPNQPSTDTGNKVSSDTAGMEQTTNFPDGRPGRLLRYPSDVNDFTPQWEVTPDGLDNRPLWEFIPNSLSGSVPAECQRAVFDGVATGLETLHAGPQLESWMNWGIDRCIFEYTCGKLDTTLGPTDPVFMNSLTRYDCNGPRAGAAIGVCTPAPCRAPVFTAQTDPNPVNGIDNVYDIVQSPRFVHIPQFWESTPPSGAKPVDIMAFRAVYIQALQANGVGKPDFQPGPWNVGPNIAPNQVAGITSFAFPAPVPGCVPTAADSCGTMLPGTLGTSEFSIGFDSIVELVS
jgi:hypothetical protein